MFHVLADDTGTSAVWAAQRVQDDHVSYVTYLLISTHMITLNFICIHADTNTSICVYTYMNKYIYLYQDCY